MKRAMAFCIGILALTLVALLPATAWATSVTLLCDPSADVPPAQWFGGMWTQALKIRIDSDAKMVEILDQDNKIIAGTLPASRLASLGGWKYDVMISDAQINWGILHMWGTSGYVDRKSGHIDLLWTNPYGFSPDTMTRQFHGTCRER